MHFQSSGIFFTENQLTKVAKGKAGTVYKHPLEPGMCIKIYSDQYKHTSLEKIEAMRAIGSPDENFLSWPIDLVTDSHQTFRGFSMKFFDPAEWVLLDCLLQKSGRIKRGLSEDYLFRFNIALNLAILVSNVHRRQHKIVDLKPWNILINKHTPRSALIDCDGFTIALGNYSYYASEYSPDYAPYKAEQNLEEWSKYDDCFSLAVIIFMLLNEGIHPFQGRPIDTSLAREENNNLASRIKIGAYACTMHEIQSQFLPLKSSIHQLFPEETRQLFESAFLGHELTRPSADDWVQHLYGLSKNMIIKPCENDIGHAKFSESCSLCERNNDADAIHSKLFDHTDSISDFKFNTTKSNSSFSSPSSLITDKLYLFLTYTKGAWILIVIAAKILFFLIATTYKRLEGNRYESRKDLCQIKNIIVNYYFSSRSGSSAHRASFKILLSILIVAIIHLFVFSAENDVMPAQDKRRGFIPMERPYPTDEQGSSQKQFHHRAKTITWVNFRITPTSKGRNIIVVINPDTIVYIEKNARLEGWVEAYYNGNTGYIYSKYLVRY